MKQDSGPVASTFKEARDEGQELQAGPVTGTWQQILQSLAETKARRRPEKLDKNIRNTCMSQVSAYFP